MRLLFAVLTLVVNLSPAIAFAAPTIAHPSDARVDGMCRKYIRVYPPSACSNAVGRWLPTVARSWAGAKRATHIDARDRFNDTTIRATSLKLSDGAVDGTPFVYGSAGPATGRAVYDPIHHLAYYDQGCCSWHETVLAAGVPAPPKPLATRNLTTLETRRGVGLGATPQQVERVYGPATLYAIKGSANVEALSYVAPTKPELNGSYACSSDQDFYFKNGKLIQIQFGDAC